MDAEAFLARLSARCSGRQIEVPEGPPPRVAPSLTQFRAELERVGGTYAEVPSADLAAAVVASARACEARTFVASGTPRSRALAQALVAAGVEEIRYPEDPAGARRALDRAHLGLVEADLALSESGTIGLLADRERGRLVSCLPRVLVAVLDPRGLLGRLEEVPGWLRSRGALPSALALLTGPSRTGDIEGRIVIGAHGPGALHVLALRDTASAP